MSFSAVTFWQEIPVLKIVFRLSLNEGNSLGNFIWFRLKWHSGLIPLEIA